MIKPHGGELIDKFGKDSILSPDIIKNLQSINLTTEQLLDVQNIACGIYSPLKGFMNKWDFESVLNTNKLANGLTWTIPIFLDIEEKIHQNLSIGEKIILNKYANNPAAILKIESKYELDHSLYSQKIFNTLNLDHPGVKKLYQTNKFILGGEIFPLDNKLNNNNYFLSPKKTREEFKKRNWNTIVGFQTRNPAHIAHEFLQKTALEFVDGLFINPIIGPKKTGDFKDDVILKVYDFIVNNYYAPNRTFLSVLPAKMNYAGPKEAVFHAIIRKNFGCSHFIVGRNHAGVGNFYDKFAAHEIFDKIEDIGITIMKVSSAFYCPKCKFLTTEKSCPHKKYNISGTEVRKMIQEKNIDGLKNIMRKEVIDIILSFDEPFI